MSQDKTEQPSSPVEEAAKIARRKLRKERPKEVQLDENGLPPVSRFQAFVPGRVARHQLSEAGYNPRIIDQYARSKLEEELKRGLVQSITWNRRTGNIVGGHQRISILDDLHGPHESCKGKGCELCHKLGVMPYSLDVDIIDVDEYEERRLNIVLNQRAMQGEFEPDKLSNLLVEMKMMKPEEFKLEETGFENLDLQMMGADPALLDQVGETEDVKRAITEVDEIAKIKELKKGHIKKDRQKVQQQVGGQVVFVFKTTQEVEKIMIAMGKSPGDEAFIDGWRLLKALNLTDVKPAADTTDEES